MSEPKTAILHSSIMSNGQSKVGIHGGILEGFLGSKPSQIMITCFPESIVQVWETRIHVNNFAEKQN